jgi:hypothetical protein
MGSCEFGKEPSGSLKYGETLDWLMLLKKNSVAGIQLTL